MGLAMIFAFGSNGAAMYMADGSAPNGSLTNPTNAGWNLPHDGICVLGLHADGTMDVDTTITNKRDCDARLVTTTAVTSNDTLANVCGNSSKNTAGVKYAAPGSSTCVTVDGSGNITGSISMVNLDRNAQMCTAIGGFGLANATGVKTTANGTAAECLAYGWQYRGQDSIGTPLAFGAKGTDSTVTSNTGFCYTSMRTSTPVANCPTVLGTTAGGTENSSSTAAFGYSVSGSYCLYAYGISGPLNAALTNTAGATAAINGVSAAAGASVNLSSLTNLGSCLANGGSWSNWMPIGPTATVGALSGINTAVTFDLTRQSPSADDGCLHCHSSLVQQNGPANRQKDSYILTGHKNMLRKVTPGQAWAGPNDEGVETIYTTYGANTLNWATAMDGTTPMYYIWGYDEMESPVVAEVATVGNYTCATCHTAGMSSSTYPGVQSIGTPGYAGRQPADSGAGYVAALGAGGYKWDREGIICSRCHNATVPSVTAAQIAASSFPTTAPTSGGMGALASGTGRTNLCFGCHFSPAGTPFATPSLTSPYTNPTVLVVSGTSPFFSGSGPYGSQFLNSPHARYAGATSGNGSARLNSLGEYDLTDPNGTTEYSSIFKGYTCFQGPTSNSVATTLSESKGVVTQITNAAQCNNLYGTGSWRADDGTVADGTQGTCTTCHDVHNSVVVASENSKSIRKTCVDCHVNNNATVTATETDATDSKAPQIKSFNHPMTGGTPFDPTLVAAYGTSCQICHMANINTPIDPAKTMDHLWRINTNATYSTYPTLAAYEGGICSVNPYTTTSSSACTTAGGTWTAVTQNKNALTSPETYTTYSNGVATGTATYANAVWVDLDQACGQCHGGGSRPYTTTGSVTAGSTFSPWPARQPSGSEPQSSLTVCQWGGSGSGLQSSLPGLGRTEHTSRGR